MLGDHTDYNYGLAVALATKAGTAVEVGPGTQWSFHSDAPQLPGDWRKYPLACIEALVAEGIDVRPSEVQISSRLPHGRGLSSSTSLTAATLVALASAAGRFDLPADRIASLSQDVENRYLGIPSGSLDQAVIILGANGGIQYIDFSVPSRAVIPAPKLGEFRLLVVDSGQSRRLGPENIGARQSECISAAQTAVGSWDAAAWKRIQSMTAGELAACSLDSTQRRRLDHIRSENDRVATLVNGVESMTAVQLADLINASHASLRDQFDVSTERLEELRDALLQSRDVLAARVVGAGFGGCLLVLSRASSELQYPSLELASP